MTLLNLAEIELKSVIDDWMPQPVTISTLAFADDLVLVGENATKLKNLANVWTEELDARGLKI